MMRDSLWDETEPLYAPCLGSARGYLYWKAPAKYRKAGYAPSSKRLVGVPGDGMDAQRAAEARRLTRDMVRWYQGQRERIRLITWGALIHRYKTDDVSPFQDVKANTKENYLFSIGRWESLIGDLMVSDADYVAIKTWRKDMADAGRSDAYIKRMFTILRILASYGVALQMTGARAVKEILGEIRVRSPKPRTSSPTEAQIMAIIAEADKANDEGVAAGLLIQWRLALRAMDVRGNYFRMEPGDDRTGICRGNFRWGDGLTWDMIDKDVTKLSKVPSKTENSLTEMIVWDLTLVPDVRARLLAMGNKVGPVITDKNGMPFRSDTWADRFAVYREAAGLPKTIWMMDIRAGAINDAKNKGATMIQLQQQANHADGKTTERYVREKSAGVNNVLKIRSGA